MTTEKLEQIVRKNLESQFTVCEAVISDAQRTVFRLMSSAEPERQLALIVDTSGDQEAHARRYGEAKFLNHPNLLGISGTGQIQDDLGGEKFPVSYILTTCPDEILAARLQPHASAFDVLLESSKQILAGLEYLHSENLVYCALRAGSVWRIGNQWKLSDYSQLRVPGTESPESARRLLVQRGITAPPEVYFGQVTPAWDVWSFGAMLGRISSPVRKREASEHDIRDALVLPPDLEEMIANCSAPDPNARPSVEELKRFFEEQEERYRQRPTVAVAAAAAGAEQVHTRGEMQAGPRPSVESLLEKPAAPSLTSEESPRFRPIAMRRRTGSGEFSLQPPKRKLIPVPQIPWARVLPVLAICLAVLLALLLIERRPASAKKTEVIGQSTPAKTSQSPVVKPSAAVEPPQALPAAEEAADLGTKQDEKAQINALLQQWASATRRRNVAEEVSCYGPVIDTYYSRHHLTSAELEEEKQRAFSEIGPVRKFDMDQVRFDQIGSGWAVVSFNKHWAFGNSGGYAGTAREQLVVREFGDEWKITSERELKVYALRSHRGGDSRG